MANLIAHQLIEQAGFAGIGLAGDDDVQSFAQQRALARRGGDGRETDQDFRDAIAQHTARQKLEFFIGEIDGGLDC